MFSEWSRLATTQIFMSRAKEINEIAVYFERFEKKKKMFLQIRLKFSIGKCFFEFKAVLQKG